ncbi:MAG: PIN domain-containing protein [Gammaproteobacteria bacterium]
MNHVLVDFENVHHIDPAIIGAKSVSLTILVGAKQTKLDAEMVVKLFEHSASVQLIRLTSSDKNAVDFALAYYLGRAVLADPTAYFHIVSKDSGYDPLIAHLASRHVRVRRHNDFSTLTFASSAVTATAAPKTAAKPKPTTATATPKADAVEQMENARLVLERLRKSAANRPKKKKTLLSHLQNGLNGGATEADAAKLLQRFVAEGYVKIDDKGSVTYHL